MFYMNYFFNPFLSIHYLGDDGLEITFNVINVSQESWEGGLS